LLLVTTLIAVGAAFFGWRARLEPQRRAAARIVELGGSVEIEQRGWLDAIWRGRDTQEVVSVTLPGHCADSVQLESFPALRHVTMSYTKQPSGGLAMSITGGYTVWYVFVIDGQSIDPRTERSRLDRLKERLPEVNFDVTHDGVIVETDKAFDGYQTFHSFR
jgi:hypothetical protein